MTLRTKRSLRRALLSFAAAFAMFTLPVTAATINVPSNATPTIQSGIDAAADGDTVLVAPGTYFENIDFKGKAITVTSGSAANAATTIIDGGSKSPTVTFVNGETRSSVLSYLTIQHGGGYGSNYTGYHNGGLYFYGSSPVILNNIVTQNACWTFYVEGSAPLIQGNTISATQDPHGTCSFGGGAAIYISGNFFGPGQSSSNGTPAVIVGNTIENNVESGLEDAGGNGGAGIAVWGGSPIIVRNTIRNNASPGGSGGAINVVGGVDIAILQNLIYGNSAGCGGGALAFQGGGNQSASGFSIYIANNTLVDNIFYEGGGGFSECARIAQIYPSPDSYGVGNPTQVMVNNIIAGNTADPAIDGGPYDFEPRSEATQPIFDHNLFYNAGGPVFGKSYVDVSTKYGNLVADPQFVDPANHDYHLKPTSPSIDAGNTSALQSLQEITGVAVTTDFDGNPRLQDFTGKGYPIIDMGAFEYAGKVDATDTTVVLTSSAYSGAAGSNNTLTATFASALGTPTGSAVFYLDGKSIGTSNIGSDGIATLNNVLFVPGVHNLYAQYAGAGSFTPATSVIIIVQIDLYTTSLTLTSAPNPSLLGQSVTFTLKVSSADSSYIPTPITLTDSSSNNVVLATLTPDSTGTATYTTAALTLGDHFINAYYQSDSIHAANNNEEDQQVINGYATTTALISSLNPATVGQSVTFTATVTSPNGTPTGLITFTDGTTTLGTATLVNGVATYSISTLTIGTHPITAAYNPGANAFSASTAILSQVINGTVTTTSLSVAPTTAVYGTSIVMTSTVNFFGSPNYSGAITFMDGSTVIATGELLPGSSTVSYIDIYLTVGTHIVTAVYSGDATHNTSTSAPVTVTITPGSAALSLTSSRNPVFALQPFTLTAGLSTSVNGIVPTGTISFSANGAPVGTVATNPQGIATLPLSLPTGVYTLTASFAGSGNFGAATSTPITETVIANLTVTALYAQPNPGFQGGNETLTAAVTSEFASGNSTGPSIPTGTVTFFDDGAPIATSAVNAAGHATFSTTAFTVGNHTLTATLNGSVNFLSSTSQPYTLAILPRDFTLTADTTLTIQTEHHKDLDLTLASIGDFSDVIALSCGPMPADAFCTFANNGALLAAGSTLPSTVRIDTDAIYNYLSSTESNRAPAYPRLRSGIAFALLLPITLFAATRRRRTLRRSIRLFVSLSILLIVTTFTGCSSHYPGHTSPGTYSITITGQGATTHISHTATVTLLVTE